SLSIDWRIKPLLSLNFSFIPRGEQLNYFVQRYLTRSLPASDTSFAATVSYAKRHMVAIQRYYDRPLAQATFYEFGAGWDMAIPLAFYGFGVDTQILVHVRNLIRLPLLNDSIDKYQKNGSELCILRIASSHLHSNTYN